MLFHLGFLSSYWLFASWFDFHFYVFVAERRSPALSAEHAEAGPGSAGAGAGARAGARTCAGPGAGDAALLSSATAARGPQAGRSWAPQDLRQWDLLAECLLSLQATLKPPR